MTLAGISAARHPTNLVGLALGPHTGLRNPGLTGVGKDAEDRDDNRFRGPPKFSTAVLLLHRVITTLKGILPYIAAQHSLKILQLESKVEVRK